MGDAAQRLARDRQPDRHFIERAREQWRIACSASTCRTRTSRSSAEGEPPFDDYVEAVSWQDYARENREAMMARVLHELRHRPPKFQLEKMAVNCHHNYVQKETHGDVDLLVTRKGAVSARAGELGIPGQHGAKSFIVRGSATRTASTAAATAPAAS